MFGAIGGAIVGAKEAKNRYHYAVKVGDDKATALTLDILSQILPEEIKKNDTNDFEKERQIVETITDKKQKKKNYGTLIEKYIPYLNQQ